MIDYGIKTHVFINPTWHLCIDMQHEVELVELWVLPSEEGCTVLSYTTEFYTFSESNCRKCSNWIVAMMSNQDQKKKICFLFYDDAFQGFKSTVKALLDFWFHIIVCDSDFGVTVWTENI